MKLIVVVGTGSGCGKTTVACRIIRAFPGLGAVKISPGPGQSRVEWGGGLPGKDTDLYAACGAARVARIVGPRDQVGRTWALIEREFEGCRGVVFEGASALALAAQRHVVFVVGGAGGDPGGDRARSLQARAHFTLARTSPLDLDLLVDGVRAFLASADG